MKAMVLAAGLGLRMRPLTLLRAKPVLPVLDRPLVEFTLERLARAGVRDLVVNLHHLPDRMKTWLDAEYAGRCAIEYSFEPEILGTGGGLRRARPHFENDEVFLLVNGDSVQWPPGPQQKAWLELQVPQCGYCQPGMLLAAAALLKEKSDPSDADTDAGVPNICRCGTYARVREAIHAAAKAGK